jgi:hypothetical protein
MTLIRREAEVCRGRLWRQARVSFVSPSESATKSNQCGVVVDADLTNTATYRAPPNARPKGSEVIVVPSTSAGRSPLSKACRNSAAESVPARVDGRDALADRRQNLERCLAPSAQVVSSSLAGQRFGNFTIVAA